MILFTKQHAFSVSDSSCPGTTTVKGIGLVLDMEHGEEGWGETVRGGVPAFAFLRQQRWLTHLTHTPWGLSYGEMFLCALM